MLEQRLLSIGPIAAGLVIEWVALWLGGFGLSWRKAAFIDVAMNGVSTIAGIVLIPLLGFAWEIFPGTLIYPIFHVGTFNAGTWLATFVMAVLVTTVIEYATVRWAFRVTVDRRRFAVLLAGNAASVAIAFVSLWKNPPRL